MTMKAWIRERLARFVVTPRGQRVAASTVGWLRGWRLRSLPAWFGELHEISVPRGVIPAASPDTASSANINVILDLVDTVTEVEGDVAECGVFRGATLIPIARYVLETGCGRRVFGFDSFQGFGEEVAVDLALGGKEDAFKRPRGFAETSYDLVWGKALKFGVDRCLEVIPGFFRESLVRVADRRFAFVHLDCDIYASYKECLQFFYPRVAPGGVILLDEYDDPPWPGCNKAVDEFLADKPERPTPIQRDNHVKFFIRKAT